MINHSQNHDKGASLRRYHALHPRPQRVRDPAFTSNNPFFDPRDLVQVKYELLRRVWEDGHPVKQAAATFGFSRPSFYHAQTQLQQEGLPGLMPQRPGPKRRHKLSESVVDMLEAVLAEDPAVSSTRLAKLLEEQLGLRVHPRSIERALAGRRQKGGFHDRHEPTLSASPVDPVVRGPPGAGHRPDPGGHAARSVSALKPWTARMDSSLLSGDTGPRTRQLSSASVTSARPLATRSAELVGVLTEMVQSGLRRCSL